MGKDANVQREHAPQPARPSLRDVAAAAGVSLATASYALKPGRRGVGEPSRQKVLRAAEHLGYEAAPPGRRTKGRLTIAAVVPDPTNSFFSEALRALELTLRGEGHRLVVASSGDEVASESDIVGFLAGKVDGLVLAPAGPLGEDVRRLGQRLPVVIMDRDGAATEFPSVSMDNFDSARRATRVLAESGCTRIAIVNGPLRVSTTRDRVQGYLRALEEAGLAAREQYMCTGEFAFDTGRRAVHSLCQISPRPDAIFSTSAILTSGVLFALREHGLRWPDDIAVVGFGDAVWASLVDPPVTVIEQPTAELGATAARMVLAGGLLPGGVHGGGVQGGGVLPGGVHGGGVQPSSVRHVVLSSRLVLRDSHWNCARDPLGTRRPLGAWTPLAAGEG